MISRLNVALLSLWLAFAPAIAQVGQIPGWPPTQVVASGSGYQGPGDVFTTSPYAWFSCARAYNASFAAGAGAMCDIVDTATGTFACTISVGTNGFANLSALSCTGGTLSVTTFCTVTHAAGCSVTKLYDQTSNGCHVTQATLASMPLLILSSTPTGTLPAIQASGAVGTMTAAACAAKAQPIALSLVAERTSGSTAITGMLGQSGGADLGFDTAGLAGLNAGTSLTLSASNSSWHAINALANGNGTASAINVDGTDQTGAAGTTGIGVNTLRAARVTALTGTTLFAEGGVWNATTTSTNRNAVCQNQANATNGYNHAFGC